MQAEKPKGTLLSYADTHRSVSLPDYSCGTSKPAHFPHSHHGTGLGGEAELRLWPGLACSQLKEAPKVLWTAEYTFLQISSRVFKILLWNLWKLKQPKERTGVEVKGISLRNILEKRAQNSFSPLIPRVLLGGENWNAWKSQVFLKHWTKWISARDSDVSMTLNPLLTTLLNRWSLQNDNTVGVPIWFLKKSFINKEI